MKYITTRLQINFKNDAEVYISPLDINKGLNKSIQKIYTILFGKDNIESDVDNKDLKIRFINYKPQIFINDNWYSIINYDEDYLIPFLIESRGVVDNNYSDVVILFDTSDLTKSILATPKMENLMTEAKLGASFKLSKELNKSTKGRIPGHLYYDAGNFYVVLKQCYCNEKGFLICTNFDTDLKKFQSVSEVLKQRKFSIKNNGESCLFSVDWTTKPAYDCGEYLNATDSISIVELLKQQINLYTSDNIQYTSENLSSIFKLSTFNDSINSSCDEESISLFGEFIKTPFESFLISEGLISNISNSYSMLVSFLNRYALKDVDADTVNRLATVYATFLSHDSYYDKVILAEVESLSSSNQAFLDYETYRKFSKYLRPFKYHYVVDRTYMFPEDCSSKLINSIEDSLTDKCLVDLYKELTVQAINSNGKLSSEFKTIPLKNKNEIVIVKFTVDDIENYYEKQVPEEIRQCLLKNCISTFTVKIIVEFSGYYDLK